MNWQILVLQRKDLYSFLIVNQNKPDRYVLPELNSYRLNIYRSIGNIQYLQLHSEIESRIYQSHIKVGKEKVYADFNITSHWYELKLISFFPTKNLKM